ncbi:MAG: sensor histidine kinase [Verrucomicrobiales bacterium]
MKIPALRSLNARLLLAIVTSILIALAIGGATIHGLFKKRLLDDFDNSLPADLTFHILACDQGDGIVHIAYETYQELRRQRDPNNPIFAQYRIAENARRYYRSPNLEERDLPPVGLGSEKPVFENIVLFNGTPARALGVTFEPVNHDEEPTIRMHVVIAKELTEVFDYLKKLRYLMYWVAAGLTVLLLASTSLILRRNLQPLKMLSQQIGERPVSGKAAYFKLSGAPAELDPVVERLNILMDRVDGALERERHFTANAAHELRNPLAGMRSQIELALGSERSQKDYRETLDGLYDIQQGMERVVENLLILARLESGEQSAQKEIVPLTEVLRRGWRKVYDVAEQKELKVTWHIQNPMPALKTSRNLISIIVRNLLDNAVDYSPQRGAVKISAHYDRLISSATIRVANQNTTLSDDDCEKMFELFWRGHAGDSAHRHAGLGLGLCRRIVCILRGELKARLTDGGQMVVFTCTFPCETLGD